MANSITYFAQGSNFTVKRGQGFLYGLHVVPRGGSGTLVVADLAEAGAAGFDLSNPSTVSRPLVVSGPFALPSTEEFDIYTHGRNFEEGLSLSFSSTHSVSVFFE